MSSKYTARNVPDSLKFLPGEGGFENSVYECVVCNTRISGTENAADHTGCPVPRECPTCGSPRGRVDLATDYGRVDICECGTPFEEHFDTGVP